MNSKKFLSIFFILALLILGTNAAINYKYDLYGIFDKDFSKYRYCYVNERYAKIDYLLHEGKGKYDTFIFGSSRSKGLNPKTFSNTTYNLAYSAGVPNDYVRDLKTLVSNGIIPKTIYIGIDDFSYKRLPEEVHGNINFIGYGSYSDNIKYKLALLFRKPTNDTVRYIFGRLNEPKCMYKIDIDGSIVGEYKEQKIDWNKYVNDERFSKPTFYPEKNKRIKETVAELMEIKSICDNNHIKLVLFMTPTHITTYLSDDIRNLNEFKYALTNIGDFYDFSIINFYTTNNYFWGETSHASAMFEEMVANVLSGREEENQNLKNKLYDLVTKENVEKHLEQMLEDREKYGRKIKKQYIPEEKLKNGKQ